jgi:hypothetical protein
VRSRYGAAQEKLAASSMLPEPWYFAAFCILSTAAAYRALRRGECALGDRFG